jgi:hypothetical protein
MRLLRLLTVIAGLLAPLAALGQQTLLQSGPWTPGHLPMFATSGLTQPIVFDSGPAGGGGVGYGVSELLLVARGTGTAPYAGQGTGPYGTNFCDYDGPTSSAAGYHYLCFSANAQGGALIAYGAGGAASPLGLSFIINGTTYAFPFSSAGITGPGSSTVGHLATWNSTSGAALADSATVTSAFIAGVTTNSDAAAGIVGEYISSTIQSGSAVSLTTDVAINITSVSLTAGDWDCNGSVFNSQASSTTMDFFAGWISTTSASFPSNPPGGSYVQWYQNSGVAGLGMTLSIGPTRISLASTTTVYLSATASFDISTNTAYGFIGCRRAR